MTGANIVSVSGSVVLCVHKCVQVDDCVSVLLFKRDRNLRQGFSEFHRPKLDFRSSIAATSTVLDPKACEKMIRQYRHPPAGSSTSKLPPSRSMLCSQKSKIPQVKPAEF